jgi:CheY-like chemotaxis protein
MCIKRRNPCGRSTSTPSNPPMPTLLIVDDNESVRESLKHVFMRRGYAVVVAEGGEEGLALHAKGGVDAALVDINMPGLNGIDVCRLLHQQAENGAPKIPVWLMTGAIGANAEERGLAAGALAVLHKPFDILAFTRDLDAQLSGSGATKAI